jgi:hypothetical protein
VFELAIALGVSPIYLLTPIEGHDRDGNAFKVWIGGKVAHWPHTVRQWIRSVRPLPGALVIDEEAERHQRFYLLESQPTSEWLQILEAGRYAERVLGSLETLQPEWSANEMEER